MNIFKPELALLCGYLDNFTGKELEEAARSCQTAALPPSTAVWSKECWKHMQGWRVFPFLLLLHLVPSDVAKSY